jgi:putative transposase
MSDFPQTKTRLSAGIRTPAVANRASTGSRRLESSIGEYTSWAFGRRLRAAGLLGSMGSVGDCFDNSAAESFFGTLQIELLDEQRWDARAAGPGNV